MSRNHCSVKGCNNSKHERPEILFHNFKIKDTIRLKKWIEFCDNEELRNLYESNDQKLENKFICSDHFEDSTYNNPMKKLRLMCNALPTIKSWEKKPITTLTVSKDIKPPIVQTIPAQYLLRTDLSTGFSRRNLQPIVNQKANELKESEESNSYSYISELMNEKFKENPIKYHSSDRYRKYESELKSLRDKLKKTKKQVLNLKYRLKKVCQIGCTRNSRKSKLNYIMSCINTVKDDSFNPVVYEIIESQLISSFLNKNRQKWSNHMKNFCSELYHKSPSAYSFLQKSVTLPSKKTILKYTQNTSLDTSIEPPLVLTADHEPNEHIYTVGEIVNNNEVNQQSMDEINQINSDPECHQITITECLTDNNCEKFVALNRHTNEITIISTDLDNESINICANNVESVNRQNIIYGLDSNFRTYGKNIKN